MAGRTVLQLGAGSLMAHTMRALKNAGFRVHAVDRDAGAPAFDSADGYAVIDVGDVEGIVRYASQIGADVIMPANEAGVSAAAEASRRLRLPNLAPEVAERSLDKGLMRDCWRAAGLRQPVYRVVEGPEEIPTAAADVGYPVVVKPSMNWGSRGVSVAADTRALPWAIDFARAHCRNGRYVVEALVPGTEITIEGLVQRGQPQVLAKSDKEAQRHPRFRVAMALNYPAGFAPWQLQAADELTARAALALGIHNGAFHCECMIDGDDIHLIEMGARGGGGHIFGQIVEAVSGVCMPEALVRIFLGEPVDIKPRYQRGACYKFFAPPSGVFHEVRGVEDARRLPGVLDLGFSLRPGTVVGAIAGDADRPGYVVAGGTTRDDAIANADRAVAAVRYVMGPSDAGQPTATVGR